MAREIDHVPLFGCRWVVLVVLILPVPAVAGALLDDFLIAADQGQCIEGVTFRLIQERGPDDAGRVVEAALEAHGQRKQQQRVLGCMGDIAAQAISAGADPTQVLQATAAGL